MNSDSHAGQRMPLRLVTLKALELSSPDVRGRPRFAARLRLGQASAV